MSSVCDVNVRSQDFARQKPCALCQGRKQLRHSVELIHSMWNNLDFRRGINTSTQGPSVHLIIGRLQVITLCVQVVIVAKCCVCLLYTSRCV